MKMFKCFNSTLFKYPLKTLKNNRTLEYCKSSIRIRFYCDKKIEKNNDKHNAKESESDNTKPKSELLQSSLETRYKIFEETDAPLLLDVYEEKMLLKKDISTKTNQEEVFYGLNLERGARGVFNIEDLVDLLRRDKAEDIFVAELPLEAKYVDYIVIVSSKSRRHMIALAEIVRRVFKKKRLETDPIPHIEGQNSTIWMAMDLGNIALHIFSRDARKIYDLESLWSLGTEYDSLSYADDPVTALLKRHSISLDEISFKG